jgi:hypothetical protein
MDRTCRTDALSTTEREHGDMGTLQSPSPLVPAVSQNTNRAPIIA